MKHLLVFMLGLSAAGCAEMQTGHVEVDPLLREQFTSFLTEAVLHGRTIGAVNLRVKFGTVPAEWAAYCQKNSDGHRELIIRKSDWLSYRYYEQEQLMFHELGHCVLNLDHDNALDAYGMPKSIMYWSMFSSYYYETNRENYLQQLFGHAKLH